MNMTVIPKTDSDWQNLIETSLRGGALVTDVLLGTPGIIQFLIGWGIKTRRSKTLKELKEIPLETKKKINKEISTEYISSDKFLVFVSNAMTEAIAVKNIEKLAYFRSAIISGMVRRDIEEGKKLLFVDALSTLSIDAIILLGEINKMASKRGNVRLTVQQIKQRTSYSDSIYLMANLRSLERYNLLEVITPTIKERDYRNYIVIYGTFGMDFTSFIDAYK